MIKSIADASRVKAYCDYVYIDVTKGASPLDLKHSSSVSPPRSNEPSSVLIDNNSFPQGSHQSKHSSVPRSFIVKPYIYNKNG